MIDSIIAARSISNPALKEATMENIKLDLMEILFDYSSRFQTKYSRAKQILKEKLSLKNINIYDFEEFIENSLIPFHAKVSNIYNDHQEMFEDLHMQTNINLRIIGHIKLGIAVNFGNSHSYEFSLKDIESYDEFETSLIRSIVKNSETIMNIQEEASNFTEEQYEIAKEYFCYFYQFI